MKITRSSVAAVVMAVLECPNIKTATQYLDERTTVKCTRILKYDARMKRHSFVLSVGIPNYAERKFIKTCKKAGEPFPVKKTQFKMMPKKALPARSGCVEAT